MLAVGAGVETCEAGLEEDERDVEVRSAASDCALDMAAVM